MSATAVGTQSTLAALDGLRSANRDSAKASERLATGLRINRAADDPAGIGRAATLKAEIGSFEMVKKSLNKNLSELTTVSDGLNSITDYLVEMRTIALAAASESSDTVRATYDDALQELKTGISEIVKNVKFNGVAVLGTGAAQTIQTGITATDTKSVTIASVSATALSINATSANTVAAAGLAITSLDSAINTVANVLAKVGGIQKSLEFSVDFADSSILAKSSQFGDIMNADMAKEATNLAAARIRQDSATAVLAQANSMNRNIADFLLKGALG
jgi:flagellin